jgi:hypothetical protein
MPITSHVPARIEYRICNNTSCCVALPVQSKDAEEDSATKILTRKQPDGLHWFYKQYGEGRMLS